MVNGIKSKEFGCFWRSMFLVAMCYPEKIDTYNSEHVKKMKHYKNYYRSFEYVIPCKFCRDFIRTDLKRKHPLDFSGRVKLMKSIYIWKDTVNKKLINQNCPRTRPSPAFSKVLKRYERYRAKCITNKGKCI